MGKNSTMSVIVKNRVFKIGKPEWFFPFRDV
jgi:hypothetical protein